MLTVLKRKLAAIGSMPFARSPLSVAVIPGLLPVLVSFRRFRAFSHARMFLSVFGFKTSFRKKFVVVCLDVLLLQILHFTAGRFVRNLVEKTFRRRAIERRTSVARKVFR